MSSPLPLPSSPRRGPGALVGVTEEMIGGLVHAFYGKIRQDPELGPIFERAIPQDGWAPHLAKMCDFWSSVMLATGRFDGAPMPAHIRLPEIQGHHFARWLGLFREAAAEVCPAEAAQAFIGRAEMIAESLKLGIAASRGELPPLRDHA